MTDIKDKALRLYKPPFRHESGFIWDSDNNMVADDGGIARVRGWGRICTMGNAEELQDKVGELIAEAMTEYWNKQNKS